MHLKLEKRLSQIVQGRSEQVSNVVTDLPKPLRTLIWSYMSATSNARGGEVGRSAAFSTKCSDGLEILQKYFKNILQRLEKKLSETIGGGSRQVRNVPADLSKPLRTEIWSYMAAKRSADGGEVGLISCILLQLSRYIATFR